MTIIVMAGDDLNGKAALFSDGGGFSLPPQLAAILSDLSASKCRAHLPLRRMLSHFFYERAVVLRGVTVVAIEGRPNRISCAMPKKIEPKAPAVECAVCGQQMKHLADLALTAAFPAARIYRCYGCDHVVQREWYGHLN